MITKYTSLLERCKTHNEQKMEFVFFKHLIVCMDRTNREFHVKYRYENPRDFFLKKLSECGHKIIKEEPIPIETDIGKLNDLNFSLYSGQYDIIVFNGIAVYGGEQGLGIIEYKNLEPGWLPLTDSMKALLKNTLDKQALEDFMGDFLEHVPSSPSLRCKIWDKRIMAIALQMEEMEYRIFDEIYRVPCESDDDEQRIEGLQIYYDHVLGYYFTIETMKRFERELREYRDDLNSLDAPHRAMTDKLGLNLQLFDADGNRLEKK